jgi:hypothetical protein
VSFSVQVRATTLRSNFHRTIVPWTFRQPSALFGRLYQRNSRHRTKPLVVLKPSGHAARSYPWNLFNLSPAG